jgi:hypothetical protein
MGVLALPALLRWVLLLLPAAAAPALPSTVYVDSRSGDDAASGLAPATAWRSLARLRHHQLEAGATVLFARGGQWRGFLVAQGGNASHGPVTYGAYGDPALEKPALLGSIAPAASDWTPVAGRGNVWSANVTALSLPVVGPGNLVTDVGNVILTKIPNGGPDTKLGRKVWSESALASPFDFYFDRASKQLLVLSPAGNPAFSVHGGTIECALVWLVCRVRTGPESCAPPATLPSNALFGLAHVGHVVVQDLALRYTAGTAIGAYDVHNLAVQRCDIRWIGGGTRYVPETDPDCTLGKCTRWGNGVELWMGATNISVAGNVLDQIYDSALTNQGGDGLRGGFNQSNITWHGNTVSRSNYCFEIWDYSPRNESVMEHVRFENNSCADSGGGWSHAVRPDKLCTHLRFSRTTAIVRDITVTGNTFMQHTGHPFGASWSVFDAPWGVGWGQRTIRSDYNRWCQQSASLGPLIVVGCIPGSRACLRINGSEFAEYTRLSGNGLHSVVEVGPAACGSSGGGSDGMLPESDSVANKSGGSEKLEVRAR